MADLPSLAGMKRGLLDEALAGYDDAELILSLQHLKATTMALDAVLALPHLRSPDRWVDQQLRDFESGYNSALYDVRRAITEHVDIDSTRANEEASHD